MSVKSLAPALGAGNSSSLMNVMSLFVGPSRRRPLASLPWLTKVFLHRACRPGGATCTDGQSVRRVGEGTAEVARCPPTSSDSSRSRHRDRRCTRGLLNEPLPPSLFYVVLQFDAERAVVPRVGQAAVDLGTLKDEASVFGKGYKLVHCKLCRHRSFSFVRCIILIRPYYGTM